MADSMNTDMFLGDTSQKLFEAGRKDILQCRLDALLRQPAFGIELEEAWKPQVRISYDIP